MSAEEMINKCIYSEEDKKAIPAEFITSKEANRLSEKGKDRLDTVSGNCEKYFGITDASYKQLYSYETGKTHAEQEKIPFCIDAFSSE